MVDAITTPEPGKINDTQVTKPVENPSQQQQTPPATPTDDLVTRASDISIQGQEPQPGSGDEILKDAGFNLQQWNDMLAKLPEEQRSQLESAYKSLQRGAEKKFQTAAQMKKEAESQLNQPWTVERVQQLLQDPTFVQNAQTVAQTQALQQNPAGSKMSDEEWSYLSDKEKAEFHAVTRNQMQLQEQMNKMLLAQEDEKLQSKYKNYDPQAVGSLRSDLLNGKVNATSEHLWKVLDYEDYGKRCYELAMQDKKMDLDNKQNASTPNSVGNGVNITQANDVPVKGEKESGVEYFKRIALHNMAKAKQASGT